MQIKATIITGTTFAAAMATLAERFVELAIIKEPTAFADAVAKRETLGSTYIGAGVAAPHYVAANLTPGLVIARPESPITWPDGHVVTLCLVLCLPPGDADPALIQLMTALADTAWLQRLSAADLPTIEHHIRQVMEG